MSKFRCSIPDARCSRESRTPLILAVETSGRRGSVALATGGQILGETPFSSPTCPPPSWRARHSAEIFPAVCSLLERFGRKPHQIEHIYISIGPGSFTGLRIATTLAKTMHLANNNVKIVAVDTSDVIAANTIDLTPKTIVRNTSDERQATSDEKIAAITDAKRGQFFIAVYQRTSNKPRAPLEILQWQQAVQCKKEKFLTGRATSDGIWKKILPDSLMTASQFLDKFAGTDKPLWLLGEGLLYYKDKFKADGIQFFDERYWNPHAEKVHLLGWKKALAHQFANPLTLQPTYLRKPDVKLKKQ